MIIDTHAHIGKILKFNMTLDKLLYSMEKYGVDFSLFSNIEGAEFSHSGIKVPFFLTKPQNKLLKNTIREARKAPDKLGALVWCKLHGEAPDEEFRQLISDNRDIIYGLKFHPFHSLTSPDDEKAEPFYKIAAEFDLPVVSHTGGCEQARSIYLYKAAQKHPELNFVMVHMDLGTDNSEALELLGKLPNLYGDTTWVPIETTVEAIRRYGSKKMLFGTDNPIDGKDTLLTNKFGERSLYQQYFNEIKELLSEEEYADLMYRNAQRLFFRERRDCSGNQNRP